MLLARSKMLAYAQLETCTNQIMLVWERKKEKKEAFCCFIHTPDKLQSWMLNVNLRPEERGNGYKIHFVFIIRPFFLRNRDVHTIAFAIYVCIVYTVQNTYSSDIDFCVLNWFAHYYIYFYLFVYFIYCYFFVFLSFLFFFFLALLCFAAAAYHHWMFSFILFLADLYFRASA